MGVALSQNQQNPRAAAIRLWVGQKIYGYDIGLYIYLHLFVELLFHNLCIETQVVNSPSPASPCQQDDCYDEACCQVFWFLKSLECGARIILFFVHTYQWGQWRTCTEHHNARSKYDTLKSWLRTNFHVLDGSMIVRKRFTTIIWMLYMQLHFSMYSTLCKVNTVYIYCDAGQLGKFTSDGRYSKQCQQGLFNVFL